MAIQVTGKRRITHYGWCANFIRVKWQAYHLRRFWFCSCLVRMNSSSSSICSRLNLTSSKSKSTLLKRLTAAVSFITYDQFLTVTYLAWSRCRALLSNDRTTIKQNSITITKNAMRKQNLRKYFDSQRYEKAYIGQCQNK